MKSVRIVVHCLVKNEERFIWYALKSVLPFVEKIMVWDTGSTDNTIKIIKSIKSEKIEFREMGEVDKDSFTNLRQQMLDNTPPEYNWLMILDGDEVWPMKSLKKVTHHLKNHPETESVVIRIHTLVGDIYHRQSENAGKYKFGDKVGHLALRFINLKQIHGLHVANPYGYEGYYDDQERMVQNRDPAKIHLLSVPYHHATHLPRSSQDLGVMMRSGKLKYELGEKIPLSDIPRIFFQKHPSFVPTVTQKRGLGVSLKCAAFSLLRTIKRNILY